MTINSTNITPPRVPIIDDRTGLISREWYRFFLNLFVLTGGGSNYTSLSDLQVGPPALTIGDIQSQIPNDQVITPSSQTQESQIAEIIKQIEAIGVSPYPQIGDVSDISSLTQLKSAGFRLSSINPIHQEGLLFYDGVDHSLAYYNEAADVTVNIGRESLVRIRNTTGSTLLNGQMVYVNGASTGWPTVTLAQANTKVGSQSTLGMMTMDVLNGDYGYVCTSGIVNDLDTSSYTAGTLLYLSATTAGEVTSTAPLQPNYVVEVATVVASDAATGRVFISVNKLPWHPSIEIRDTAATVTLPTTPTVFKPSTVVYNDGFSYDAATGVLTVNTSYSYSISVQFNAQPSAANKNIYFYVEMSSDGGSTWAPVRYSGRQLILPVTTETQIVIAAAVYYPVGTKLRYYIWGDATVSLKTTDLPGTTAGTVTKPAYRFQMA